LATVNGKAITQLTFDTYSKLRGSKAQDPKNREAVVNELISRELMYQEALKQGLEKDPDLQMQLELQRQELLIGALVRKEIGANPPSEAELKDAYNQAVQGAGGKEFKARHILVKTEDDAKNAIAELNKGADFAELAKKLSTGPSGPNGGDLGWFSEKQMVPEFSAAVAKMEKGKFTETPVKTQFGWHVILLEDSREIEPPAFEDVKDQVRKAVQNQKLMAYIEQLRSRAKISVNQ
jgi:peptidyl-prolyl cis-trans isomerase C